MDEMLSRAVWNALTGRQAALSIRRGAAVRIDPAHGLFAAPLDRSDASLADLVAIVPTDGAVALVEENWTPPPLPGIAAAEPQDVLQMVWRGGTVDASDVPFEDLGETDAAQMFALARVTQPGPFFEKTHRLGDFIGVRDADGRLLAMAGERLKPAGCTEVSAICTHPDARGRGHGAALTRVVTARILARGETPFLHVFAHNQTAIRLYEALGFRTERVMRMTVLRRS
jgi:predicted GNAT family acetyltransferase